MELSDAYLSTSWSPLQSLTCRIAAHTAATRNTARAAHNVPVTTW